MFRSLSVALLVLGVGAAAVLTPSVRSADDKDKKGEVIKTNAKDTPLARTIDFPEALGVHVPSLLTLGGRIDLAREEANPVCLALAAKELAAAEKAGGKMAAVKAADLEKEAAEMAARRVNADEIKIVQGLVSEEKCQKLLEEALAKTKERTKGITGTCRVVNTSGRTVAIYINDQYRGWVNNNDEREFYVGNNPWDTTKLFGRSGGRTWGPRYVSGEHNYYTWNLFP
jgi:hypothetical protein